MAGRSFLKAICLALILIFCFAPVGWTEPPGGYTPGTTPTNGGGGEGHPWDDGTVEGNPGDTTGINQPVQSDDTPALGEVAAFGAEPTGGVAIRRALMGLWNKLVSTEISVIRNSSKLKARR